MSERRNPIIQHANDVEPFLDLQRGPFNPELANALIDAAGEPAFATLMLNAAQRIDSVREVFGYRVAEGSAPVALFISSELDDSVRRSAHYAENFYLQDPVLAAHRKTRIGSGFASQVRAREIGPRDYRAICFEQPRFIDKLCFGWRSKTCTTVVSFYRQKMGEPLGASQLATLAGLGLTALARKTPPLISKSTLPFVERLEQRLAGLYPVLTHRERQVCARTIAGWTAERTARALGIRPSTVLTYRQRAYVRLGFSGANNFLSAML